MNSDWFQDRQLIDWIKLNSQQLNNSLVQSIQPSFAVLFGLFKFWLLNEIQELNQN